MKDRVTRSNIKKPTHRLFRAMMVISVFTVVCTAFLSVVLFHVSNENKVLLNKIENYTVQIDLLENSDDSYLKYQNTNNDWSRVTCFNMNLLLSHDDGPYRHNPRPSSGLGLFFMYKSKYRGLSLGIIYSSLSGKSSKSRSSKALGAWVLLARYSSCDMTT